MRSIERIGRVTEGEPDWCPDEADLECVRNRHADTRFGIRLTAPKFTSRCEISKEPIYAQLVIDYVPSGWLIDSLSLKRYLDGYRYFGAFHETATVEIGKELVRAANPEWLRVAAFWTPPCGVPVAVYFATGLPPADVEIAALPDKGVPEI